METIEGMIDKQLNLQARRNPFSEAKEKKLKSIPFKDEKGKKLQISLPYDDISVDENLVKPFKYLISGPPGKNFRHALVLGLNYWLKAPQDIVDIVAKTSFLQHNYSLMLDDIQDGSLLRRGLPCSHLIYGKSNTINSTDFCKVNTSDILCKLNNPLVSRIFYDITMDSLRGQAMEIHWRDRFICPTEEEYKLMVLRKTGFVFDFMNRILRLYSTTNVDTVPLIRAIALYFQINDDYQNLNNDLYHDSKGYCEDISEGKFSFPIIYVVQRFKKEGKILTDILRQRTQDLELKRNCKSIIEKCGGFEYTKQIMNNYRNIIREELKGLEPNPYLSEVIIRKLLKIDFNVA